MKILMISSDPKVLEDSDIARRMEEYRQLVDELHVVVIAGRCNVAAFFRAYHEGGRVLRGWGADDILITVQDPAERWLVGWLLSRRFGVPFQIQIHTDMRSMYWLRESLKNRLRLFIARSLLPKATCIRVVSERVQRGLIEWLPALAKKMTILPIYVDVGRFRVLHRVEEEYGAFQFLMVSRLTREKNIPLALDAFANIHAEFPKTKLVIVGDGPLKQKLETYALRKNLSRSTAVFTGWKEDWWKHFQHASCYLLTSNYEGYSRSVIEALALGVPVIMTDVGVAGEVVKHEESGLIVPVGDKAKLVFAMQRFLTDSHLRRFLHDNSRNAVRAYPSKEEYLKAYKHMWQTCGKTNV